MYRNYEQKKLVFNKNSAVIIGNNAAGKTNILEAIYLLSTGNSIRASKIEELVHWGQEVGHVIGNIQYNDDDDIELQATVTRGVVQGRRVSKRRLLVNGVPRVRKTFVSHLQCVLFTPQDLLLISGSPSRRRAYLDAILIQAEYEYYRSLTAYEKGLRRRNKLLFLIREGQTSIQSLLYWDHLLIKEGEHIRQKREALVNFLNQQPNIEVTRTIQYTASPITESRLAEYQSREIAAGHTLIGPHKDDFAIYDEQAPGLSQARNLATYGSRGEQRMTVLWLKIGQLAYIESIRGHRPVLLLDDIFSELDNHHDELVFDLIGQQQTIIATTDMHARLDQDTITIVNL